MKTTTHTLAGLRPVAIILVSLFASTAVAQEQQDPSLPFTAGKGANASYDSVAVVTSSVPTMSTKTAVPPSALGQNPRASTALLLVHRPWPAPQTALRSVWSPLQTGEVRHLAGENPFITMASILQ